MSDFRIFETEEFSKAIAAIAAIEARWIRKKLDDHIYPQLKSEPFYGANIKKLRGYSPDTWRYRIGRFRVFYAVDPEKRVVFILTLERRRDAYK